MRFSINVETLLKQLQLLSGVVNTNNTLPILENVLFDINQNQLTLTASDLETTIITQVEANVAETGMVAIPAKMLIETLKTFPNIPLNFIINKETFNIEISSDYGKYKIAGSNPAEFPKTPEKSSVSEFKLPARVLADGINKTIFATGNDDMRPAMMGVFVQINESDITFAATDAHKLVKYKRTDLGSDSPASFIIAKKPLNIMKNMFAGLDDEANLEFNPSHLFVESGKIQIVSRLIDAKYPNYEAVIPKENPNMLTIKRMEFLTSIKRVSIFSNKTTHQIKLKIAGNQLVISTQDFDFNNEASESLTCEYEGNDIEIGFNSKFLMEMLNNINSDMVNLKMSSPNRAGLLLPVDTDNTSEELIMLVMPLMIKTD